MKSALTAISKMLKYHNHYMKYAVQICKCTWKSALEASIKYLVKREDKRGLSIWKLSFSSQTNQLSSEKHLEHLKKV